MMVAANRVEKHSVQGARSPIARAAAWLRKPAAQYWILAAILLAAAYLRLSHLNWDLGTHVHPDENFLTMVTSSMRMPASLKEFFDSTTSPMNPYNSNYPLFVYGSLPLFIVRVAAEMANKLNTTLLFWTQGAGNPVDLTSYGAVYLVGRVVSALFDLASVLMIFVLGRRLYGPKVGLLGAALYGFAAFPLQQSHFYTVDTASTFFALLTLYFAVRVAQGGEAGRRGGGWGTYVALGATLGASLACRINLLPLAGIALLAAGIRAWDDWKRIGADGGSGDGRLLSTLIQATLFRLLIMVLLAVAVFRMAQPYAFGGTSLLDFSFAPRWLDNMREISRSTRLEGESPPAHQWANRTPFVFPFVNMVFWGMGLPLGVAAWAGWLVAALQVLRALTLGRGVARARPHILLVVWIGGMFLWQGMQAVASMRYLLPLYPLLALLAAWLLGRLVGRAREVRSRVADPANSERGSEQAPQTASGVRGRPRHQRAGFGAGRLSFARRLLRSGRRSWFAGSAPLLPGLAYAALAVVVIGTMLWGWGFAGIYRRTMTRVEASRWMYANIPPGSHIGIEHWDEGLPLSIDGKSAYGGFGFLGLSSGEGGTMPMSWEDVPEKREGIYRWLDEADYIVVSSNRRWASAPRMPLRFPLTIAYYQRLFAGELGFEQVLHVKSFITVFGVEFDDNWAEEAFSVYDHPQVFVFRKTSAYSQALVRSYLDPIDLEQVIPMTTRQASAAPTGLYMSDAEAAVQQAGGTWSEIFDLNALVNRSPVAATAAWLLLVELLGIVAFPIAFVVLKGLGDRGYGVSKVLGVLALAWLSWIGPSLKVVPYSRWWIAACLGLLIGVSASLAWRRRAALWRFVRERSALLLTEEAVFLLLFALFLLIRVGNPDLWHPARGGEKPMDFAYLNAVIRSTTFPPYDPWHAGGFMNYYYFGFVIVGTLIKLTGIVPWVAYNLAVPTLFGLTGAAAFSVAFNLADGDRGTGLPGEEAPYRGLRIGSLLAGLAGTIFVVLVGNLGNVKLLVEQIAQRSTAGVTGSGLAAGLLNFFSGVVALLTGKANLQFPNDWWFWNASRVIPDTINEFPFFTFTYADLHAHMIALPLTLLALAIAVATVRNGGWVSGIGYSAGRAHTQYPISPDEPNPWRISLPELSPILLLGLTLGALRATNTWDFPTCSLAALAALVVREVTRRRDLGFPAAPDQQLAFLFRASVSVIWRAIVLLAVATVVVYPYSRLYATAYAGLQPYREATTRIPDYLVVHGFFLVVAVIALAGELIQQARDREMPAWLRDILPFVIAAGVLLLAAGWILKARVWVIALPLAFLAVILAAGRTVPPSRRLGLLLLALALAIILGVEVVRQRDDIGRMNTVFKFYMQAWTLFGVTAAYGLATWLPRSLRWRPVWRRLAWAAVLILFVGTLIYPLTAARAKIRDRFSAEASPRGIDGMAYMDRAVYYDNNQDMLLADDRAAMLWLMENVQGSPVILEGQVPEYRWGSRYSIYTGLPTVQGWNWHQRQQRSVVPAVVERRVSQVQELYSTSDLVRTQKLLDRHNVQYIVVGGLERAYYPLEGLAKFDALADQGYLREVYRGGAVTIYQVIGRGTPVQAPAPEGIGPQPVPTPTPGPVPAGTAASPLPSPDTFGSPQQ